MSDPKERTVTFSFAEVPCSESSASQANSQDASKATTPVEAHVDPTANGTAAPPAPVEAEEAEPKKAADTTAAAAEPEKTEAPTEAKGELKKESLAKEKAATKDFIGAPRRPKFVFCEECGMNVPIEEWPDHRDRLRKVKLVEQVTTYQRSMVRLLGIFLTWIMRSVYFREVTLVGEENIPRAGAAVFYGNHQNQFIDPLMLTQNCGRQVRFIMAEKSYKERVMGFFGRMFNSVPVVRPQDVPLTPGVGMLVKMDGVIITGANSTFQTLLANGDVIVWTVGPTLTCRAQVSRIHSDTKLEVTIPIADDQKVTSPTEFKISRRIDHSEMYTSVYNTLHNGHCIGIFPEGGSHDHTSLLPLKAGVALFSLGAAERNIPVKIVPCGLTYLYGHKFRSRAYLEFGEPITPSDELVELFGHNKREATGRFLDQLNDALRAVTINAPDWETLKFLHSFRQLYTPPNCTLSAKDYLRLTRRLSVIIEDNKDDAEFTEFRERVTAYKDFCSALLVRDSQVTTLNRLADRDNGTPQIRLLLRRLFTLFLMGVILLPFFVFAVPLGAFLEYNATKFAARARAASNVKLVGADVKGSFKILTGLVLFPLEVMLLTFFIYLCTDIRTALVLGFSFPMAMYVSLLILQEAIMELRAALPLLMSLLSKHKQFKKLYEKREALATLATEFVRRFDPELDEEMKVYTQVAEVEDELSREPSLFSLRYNVRRRRATNA